TYLGIGRPAASSHACNGAPRTHRPTVPTRALTTQTDSVNTPPLQLSPVTADIDEAREWMEVFRPAGVEGLVVKGASSRYVAGRGWVKYKSRETVEVIAGSVIGPLARPEVLIAGRYRGEELVQVGRSVPLTPEQSAALAAVLLAAGPDHPWPDEIGTGRWGGKSAKVPLTKVEPSVVVVSADAALQAGQWRHPLRVVRIRADLQPDDVPALPGSGEGS
ncbi:hypothetical protein ACIPOG_00055, partial [Kriegella sp. LARHCF250]